MRTILVSAFIVLVSSPIIAEDFFVPNGPGARLNAEIYRVIPQAMTEGTLIENELNVQSGNGAVICQQGVVNDGAHAVDVHSNQAGSKLGPIVMDSTNVCISN